MASILTVKGSMLYLEHLDRRPLSSNEYTNLHENQLIKYIQFTDKDKKGGHEIEIVVLNYLTPF
jgi:hypothetical protein